MDSLIHADIFFFITGIAVIVFASACVVALVYLILIFRDVRYMVGVARDQAERLHHGTERVVEWFKIFRGKVGKATARHGKRKVAETKE